TIEQFITVEPLRRQRSDHRFARAIRRGRRWLVPGILLALAACDTASPRVGPPAPAESLLSSVLTTNPAAPPADRGRAVARVPTESKPEPTPAAIVVRGREPDTRPRITVPDGEGKAGEVTLNFAGADVRDVVAAILGDTLKLNYVVDPEVAGPVTININKPLPRDELLSTLETVLNSRGATMVRNDGIVRVMPLRKEGKPGSAAPIVNAPSAPVGQNNGVFNLRYVSA